MPRYSIFPIYSESGVWVVNADNLKQAIELAFDVRLQSVAKLHARTFEERDTDTKTGEALFYALVGALGIRADNAEASLLCSATVITYSHDVNLALARDVASVTRYIKEDVTYDHLKDEEA